jgi:taurine dioxygenase
VLADRKVLVFRDQDLSPHQYAEFLRIFGTPVKEDIVVDRNHPPEVGAIHTRSNEQQQINFWHMDHSFRELPTRVLSLYAKILPPVGGDTLFASLAAAYDALSDELKERIEGLHCYHRVTATQNTKRRYTKEEAEALENAPPVVHPLVPRDPGNGRRYLFVNVPIYCRGIVELPTAEGDRLLRELYRHTQRPEFHFRLVWRPNTVVAWENNHTLHYPVSDYFPHERRLWRGVIEPPWHQRRYCSSDTCSIHATVRPSSASEKAICDMPLVGVAPCQCFAPGGIHTMSPGLTSRTTPSHYWTRPTPAVTIKV